MVSACLIGVNCRWNGEKKENKKMSKLFLSGRLIPFCPELLAGFGTPREKVTIDGKDGFEVIKGRGRMVTESGKDCTEKMLEGAKQTAKFAEIVEPDKIYLKAKSPSCGVLADRITGVTAALLKEKNLNLAEVP